MQLMKKRWRHALLVLVLGLLIVGLFEGINLALLSRWNNLSDLIASRIVALANAERASLNLPGLKENDQLKAAAQQKAEDMAKRGYFSHQSPEGETPWTWLSENGYGYLAAGENLAINFDDSRLLNKAWMNSPAHRANIVRADFQEIGVGIARGRYEGGSAVFVVQFFGTPVLQ